MKMNEAKELEVILSEEKLYVHLTREEILNFTKGYIGSNEWINKWINEYKVFKVMFNNLNDFENVLKNKEKSKELVKAYNWYIKILGYYKRINIPENIIFRVKIRLYEFENIDDEITFLKKKFKEILCEKYKYNEQYVIQVLCEIVRLKLFYQQPLRICLKKINEYLEIAISFDEYKNNKKNLINTIIRFLYEIEYIKESDLYSYEEPLTINSKNTSEEYKRVVNEYMKQCRDTKATKTFRAIKSHLKNFFDFMEDKFPEIDKFNELTNEHIREYIKYLKKTKSQRNEELSPGTINGRIEECKRLFNYVEQNITGIGTMNIITKYDRVKEYKSLPKYTSKSDVIRLIKAINEIDEEKYMQEKLIIILMVDTGRRFHEVRCLSFSCLQDDNYIFFHKTKKGVSIKQKVGDISVKVVLKAQKICKDIDKDIYSKADGLKIRRLFASKKNFYRTLVSEFSVAAVFKEIQIKNGIVDYKNEPLFALHDNKRNFISNMESAGVTATELAKLLDQNINTIAQYEVRNDKAIRILKKLEEKGALIGRECTSNNKLQKESLYNILNQKEIIERNKINLIEKVQNPKEVIPLPIGECTNIEDILLCGQLFCMACENYTLINDKDKEKFEEFCEKFFIHMYMYKKDDRLKEIRRKFEEISNNILINNNIVSASDLKKYANGIKKRARIKVEEIKNGKL